MTVAPAPVEQRAPLLRAFRRSPSARALAVCAAAGVLFAMVRDEWRSLPDALARRGLTVEPESVHWLDPPGIGARRAIFLAREGTAPDAPDDVFVVTARTAPGDRVISVRDVSNLTRSREADEQALVASGQYAAFAARVGGELVAFTVLDTRGERDDAPADRGARLRGAVTRLQKTGRPEGYGSDRFDLAHPVRSARLEFREGMLEVTFGDGVVRVDPVGPRVLAGESLVRERRHESALSPNWVTWAVDTVRALPWVGPAPIAWAESWAFRAENVVAHARVAAVGDHTQRDVEADLADVLSARPAGTSLEGRVVDWPPAPLATQMSPALPHEGEWSPVPRENDPFVRTAPGAPPSLYITFVRTDPSRVDSRAYITVWDPRQLELHVAPGSDDPMGATGETGTGAIPRDERTMTHLVGAFNGAFQAIHGEYGVYGEGMVLLPGKAYAATYALLEDGTPAFGSWPPDLHQIPDNIVEFRQNLTAMVDHGEFNPWGRTWWGGVVGSTTDDHTTRSALCMTREGFLAYIWGSAFTPQALGRALVVARCDFALHLDMNGANTGFELYRAGPAATFPPLGRALLGSQEAEGPVGGMPGTVFRMRRLVRGMSETIPRYIKRDPRDFFYLLQRSVLPGDPLATPVTPAQPGEGTWHVAGLGDVPFPWPMARTRVRPDPSQPERWVNLLRVDPRRVQWGPPTASEGLVARWMGATLATGTQRRIAIAQPGTGPEWRVGAEGDGVGGEVLSPGMAVLRGAGVDASGFLVIAVADRALPDLVNRALDLAGCGPERIALPGASLALPDGTSAIGDPVPATARAGVSLVLREARLAQRIFPEVTAVPLRVWQPIQRRQVRYNYAGGGAMTIQLSGRGSFMVPIPGVPHPPAGGTPAATGAH